jgi:hydroxyethylthiazole kinase-like uncharacterized protein yjeF
MKILSSEQMRNIDRRATESFGVPSIVLMENAAIAVVEATFEHFPEAERAAIFCGPGANGGDGFAVARHLENRGMVPLVFLLGDRAKYSGDARTNLTVCERMAMPIYEITDADSLDRCLARASETDVVIDAIFGTGLNRVPEGLYAEAIRGLQSLRVPVVAVDVPSGANASTAEPFDPCVQAEVTVTFAQPKLCHVFEPAAMYCGEVIVADIAIPHAAVDDEDVHLALIAPDDLRPLVAPRLAETHKGTYGQVVIVGGSPGRAGAAVLAARGAIRSGAGLVRVATDAAGAAIVTAASPEAVTSIIGRDVAAVAELLQKKDAVLIGPGLADDDEAYAFARALIATIDIPSVIDASALNAFAGRAAELHPHGSSRILTPHPRELSRLLGRTTEEIQRDRIGAVRDAAALTGCIVVLKGHLTLVAEPDGHVAVNPTGNPGMATGGMGDVLGGAIVALLARGNDPFEAACAGVYLHGLAGDMAKEDLGDTGLSPLDVAERLPLAMQRLRSN